MMCCDSYYRIGQVLGLGDIHVSVQPSEGAEPAAIEKKALKPLILLEQPAPLIS